MSLIVIVSLGWSLVAIDLRLFVAFFVRYHKWKKNEIQKINEKEN